MSDDRKYKQRGYKDFEDGVRGGSPGGQGLPRMPVITDYKETVRCDQCGADLSTMFEISRDTVCPKCQEAMHTCRTCHHFDPSARWECTQPIKERVTKKSAANTCLLFKVRTIRVKDLGSGPAAPSTPQDARKALEDLFKK